MPDPTGVLAMARLRPIADTVAVAHDAATWRAVLEAVVAVAEATHRARTAGWAFTDGHIDNWALDVSGRAWLVDGASAWCGTTNGEGVPVPKEVSSLEDGPGEWCQHSVRGPGRGGASYEASLE